jgi:hypothetical protein
MNCCIPLRGGAGIYAVPMNCCIPSRGGAGIDACGQAAEEIGFSR